MNRIELIAEKYTVNRYKNNSPGGIDNPTFYKNLVEDITQLAIDISDLLTSPLYRFVDSNVVKDLKKELLIEYGVYEVQQGSKEKQLFELAKTILDGDFSGVHARIEDDVPPYFIIEVATNDGYMISIHREHYGDPTEFSDYNVDADGYLYTLYPDGFYNGFKCVDSASEGLLILEKYVRQNT